MISQVQEGREQVLAQFAARRTGLRTGPGQTVEPRREGVWECRLGKGEGEPLAVTLSVGLTA